MVRIMCAILSLLFLSPNFSAGADKKADALLGEACDSLAVLDFEKAYKKLDEMIKDFPESEEACKAKVLKLEISTAETIANDHHWQYFRKGSQAGEGQPEFSALMLKAADKVKKSGDKVVKDAGDALRISGKKLKMEVSLQKTVKAATEPPPFTVVDQKWIKFLEEYEIYSMFTFVNGLTLGSAPYMQVGMAFTEPTYGSVSYGPGKLTGEVSWGNLFLCAGESLLYTFYRWQDSGEKEKVKEAALLAKELFEKARGLLTERPDEEGLQDFINGRLELSESFTQWASMKGARFSGEVSRGEKFEKEVRPNFVFRLVPLKLGWTISVGSNTSPDSNFSAVVTPPFRGINMIYIEGWHFRNSDNSGPNEVGPKNVNAPQELRKFHFALNDTDYQMAFDALQKRLWPSSYSAEEVQEANDIYMVLRKGEGRLTIKEMKFSNLNIGQRAGIDYMKFDVELDFPSGL